MYEVAIIAKDGRVVRRYELSGERPTVIGRGRDCDIQIAIATVSRKHAQVTPQHSREGFIFRDLGSTHGCYVSGRRVREINVSGGLEVQIGPATLRFENLASRIGAELDRAFGEDEAGIPGEEQAGSMDDTMI